MLIQMNHESQLGNALKTVRTYRTMFGRFVITLNGVVVLVLTYQRD